MKKTLALALVLVLALSLIPAFAAAKTFADVPASHWAYPYVSTLTQLGAMEGYTDGTFKPDQRMTVAEYVKTVVGAVIGAQAAPSGAAHWAQGYMTAAEEAGILLPDEYPLANWNDPALRQDMAKIAARASEQILKEAAVTGAEELAAGAFKDWDGTCPNCKPYIAQAYAKGLILGMDGQVFEATSSVTRAQASTIVQRLIDKDYRYSFVGGVPFCAKTDVSDAGLMKMAAAERFIYKTLETLRFYKEDGKYFFTVTLPEVPTGYEMWFEVDMNPGLSFAQWFYFENPGDRLLPKTGTITRELHAEYMPEIFQKGTIQTLIGVTLADDEPEVPSEGHANILAIYNGGKLEEFYTKTDPDVGTGKDMALTYSDYFDF